MKRTKIKDIFAPELIGTEVNVKGWVRTRRGNKHVQFIALNDGSSIKNIQIVVDLAKFTDEEQLKLITTGASLSVTGKLVESMGKGQTAEIQAESITVLGTADPDEYPLQKKGHTLEFLREKAHLRPRTNTFGAILRIRSTLAFAIHKFFNDRGFFYLHTPLITASDCEGAGAMFQVTTLDVANPPAKRMGPWTIRRISSESRPHSLYQVSLRVSSEPPPWVQSTPSAPHSVRRTPTPPPSGRVLDD